VALILVFVCTALFAQERPKKSRSQAKASPSPTPEQTSGEKKKSGGFDLTHPAEAVTTEIFADEAFFDSPNNVGKFNGHVKVSDPRFAMQSDKLTAYISKENKGLEKAVADSNVAVVRDRPDPNGGPPQRTIGLSDNAIYTTNDGIVQLTGNPRVQQGVNMHIATSPDTVMILNQEGQLTTRGPSRTEIRQEPSPSPSPGASASPSPSPSVSPKQ
jgi:lipopolysaccharide transport protein LptA